MKKMNKTLGTDLPKNSKAEVAKILPKKIKMDEAVQKGNKAKAQKIYAEIKPHLTAGHRKAVEGAIASIPAKKPAKKTTKK